MTTRRPLIGTLLTDHTKEPSILMGNEGNLSDGVEVCPDEVAAKIEQLTQECVSSSYGAHVVDKPIYLQYTRRSGPTFTLIDLPGITQNLAEDPSADIHTPTMNMVRVRAWLKHGRRSHTLTKSLSPNQSRLRSTRRRRTWYVDGSETDKR